MKNQEPKVLFGQRLAQARKMRGLSLRALADAMTGKVSYNALHRYEQGVMMPGDDVLIAVADALDQPLDFFFRPATARLQEINFRKTTKVGAKTVAAIREQSTDFFERYIEIENILGLPGAFKDPLGNLRLHTPADAEAAAEKVRAAWRLGLDPLPNVLETLESNGLKVFEVDAPESFDGFSGWADGHPIVVLAKWLNKDLPRKRFSALHEAAHILIHAHIDSRGKETEPYCNRFAGAMLIPQKVFKEDWGGYRNRISQTELIDLKRRYGMSIAAIMHRALDLGLLDPSLYRRFCIMRRKERWDVQEPGDYPGTERSSRFDQLVLRAAAEEIVSLSKGAALLNESIVDFREKLSEVA
jgi:Zn-dependent peptidase ImmA (M78 family)